MRESHPGGALLQVLPTLDSITALFFLRFSHGGEFCKKFLAAFFNTVIPDAPNACDAF
jgi:hypothetical protein